MIRATALLELQPASWLVKVLRASVLGYAPVHDKIRTHV